MKQSKYKLVTTMYQEACKHVVANPENWMSFLQSACRNYKLRFDEQLLVHEQRPDAMAVLEIDRWNQRFGRWVNRGATGIAVFRDLAQQSQRIKYYFDVSDTHESDRAKSVPIWHMKQEHESGVKEALEASFGIQTSESAIEEHILQVAKNVVEDNLIDYMSDLHHCIEDCYLDGLEQDMMEHLYRTIVTQSVAYMLMTKMDLDTTAYFEVEDFREITNFNTAQSLNAMGIATSDISAMVLHEIAKTIHLYQDENRTIVKDNIDSYNEKKVKDERSMSDESNRIHTSGRLQYPESNDARTTSGRNGQVRTDEKRVSDEPSQSDILQLPDGGNIGEPPSRNRGTSTEDGRTAREADGGNRRIEREIEGRRNDEVGGKNEQHSQRSSGNREDSNHFQFTLDESKLLPSVEEQKQMIEGKAGERSSAFRIPQQIIDDILLGGSGVEKGKERIYNHFESSLSSKENAEFLKHEYGTGGRSHAGGHEEYQLMHDAKGMRITKGYSVDAPMVQLSWMKVATRIFQLIQQKRYIKEDNNQRNPLASKLTAFMKEYDPYEYNDQVEQGESEEDEIRNL